MSYPGCTVIVEFCVSVDFNVEVVGRAQRVPLPSIFPDTRPNSFQSKIVGYPGILGIPDISVKPEHWDTQNT